MLIDTTTNFLSTILGLNASYLFKTASGATIVLSAYVKWKHEFLGADEDINTYFAGAPSNHFNIDTAEPDQDTALLGFSLLRKAEQVSFKASYQAHFGENTNTHQVSLEVQYSF